jgi:hypothetical protein
MFRPKHLLVLELIKEIRRAGHRCSERIRRDEMPKRTEYPNT